MCAFPKHRGTSLGYAAAVSCVLLSLSSQALAAAITYNFTGNVTKATGIFAGQGSVVTGTFTFDDRMLDWEADPYRDVFKYENPAGSRMQMRATVNVGTAAVIIDPTEPLYSDIRVTDGYHNYGCTDMEGCDVVQDALGFHIYDYFTSVLTLDVSDASGQAIAAGAGSLSSTIAGLIDIFDHLDLGLFPDLNSGSVMLGSWDAPHDELSFTWTGVSRVQDEDPAPVPEPAALALLGLGFAGLGAGRRRKKTAD